jgi:hypothetical protein
MVFRNSVFPNPAPRNASRPASPKAFKAPGQTPGQAPSKRASPKVEQGRFRAAAQANCDDLAAELNLSPMELDIAMDMIAQLIPHLDLRDCRKVMELAEAQALLLEIMGDRQNLSSPAAQQRQGAA